MARTPDLHPPTRSPAATTLDGEACIQPLEARLLSGRIVIGSLTSPQATDAGRVGDLDLAEQALMPMSRGGRRVRPR
jgi:hypothetical protein